MSSSERESRSLSVRGVSLFPRFRVSEPRAKRCVHDLHVASQGDSTRRRGRGSATNIVHMFRPPDMHFRQAAPAVRPLLEPTIIVVDTTVLHSGNFANVLVPSTLVMFLWVFS